MEQIKLIPVEVEYCPKCTLPFEYCEYTKKECSKKVESTEKPAEENANLEE